MTQEKKEIINFVMLSPTIVKLHIPIIPLKASIFDMFYTFHVCDVKAETQGSEHECSLLSIRIPMK